MHVRNLTPDLLILIFFQFFLDFFLIRDLSGFKRLAISVIHWSNRGMVPMIGKYENVLKFYVYMLFFHCQHHELWIYA